MNEVKPMLVYNDKISEFSNHVITSNIGINKSRHIKFNIGLNFNLVKNT
jgi:hypothetical protein